MTSASAENLFLRAPEIHHLAAPYCLNASWQAEDALDTARVDGACVATRTYVIRSSCNTRGTIHCFFFAAFKDSQRGTSPSLTELRQFTELVALPPVLRELRDKFKGRPLCSRPFSAGTIKSGPVPGAPGAAGEYVMHGVVYHCHCRSPFSRDCWLGTAAAMQHLRSISSSGLAARAAEARRAKPQPHNKK
ncbi:nuclear protein UL55 [Macacine alphaherpesvirus 1]|nr:nuclear protein UL55 [Macacine alphaherpesvirus 1]ARS02143.1 nuclear protein UL55 [Macacine alphaherpesvirus 1]ARS02218.1 nuclear protein UL55 [Macacine alphaherpesvirus 1]ARS02293.1 nuclear protein UL55 [Macacine alphaherpesvirus 1]ARS02368.1 nuclear protein UL55 [Macacine alphaherpesvirus 1]